MNLSEPFIRRPVMTMLVTLSAIVFGVFAYLRLPVSDLPDVDYPVIQVSVSYPGASATTMAANVASPLEQQFMQIPGLALVTSSNTQGQSNIILQFNLEKKLDAAATDVQSAINQATGSLPQDLPSPPTFQKTNPNAQPIFYIGLTSESMTPQQLYDYAFHQIAQRINVLSGVSSVAVYGAPRAVRIEVNPQKLYHLGLSVSDITRSIRAGTNQMATGSLQGQASSYVLFPKTQLDYAAGYEKLIIAYRGGAPVYLRDVARAVDSSANLDLKIDFWSRELMPFDTGLVMAVSKAEGTNAVAVAKDIRSLLYKLRKELPASVELVPIYDQSINIIHSVNDVKETLFVAFVLVVLVIFLFLGRVRDTFIPIVALPMSLLLTFIVMYFLGYSLDNLSLMALTLSIGFLVDDAIVFLENMVRRMEDFKEGPFAASIAGAKEISFTILSMTLSLAAVFIPLVFMPGLMGRLFREFSVTIVVATLASGIVSLTLTPMMCARTLQGTNTEKTWLEKNAHRVEHTILKRYGVSLHWFLKHKWVSLLIWVVCLLGTIVSLIGVPKTFLPQGDSGFIQGIFLAETSTSPKQMQKYQEQIKSVLEKHKAVNRYVSVTGVERFLPVSQGFMFIFLEDAGKRLPIEWVTQELQGQLFGIPGLLPLIRPQPTLEINTGGTATHQGGYAYSLSGLDASQVYKTALQLMNKMRGYEGFTTVSSDLFLDNLQLNLSLCRDQASTYGVTAEAFSSLIRDAFSQNYAYLIKGDFQQYQVIVEAAEEYRNQPDDLEWFFVKNSHNILVPFRSIASSQVDFAPLSVNHINNFTSVTLFFDLAPGEPIGNAIGFLEKTAEEVVPPQIMKSLQGEAQLFKKTIASLMLLMLAAVFVMYVILGILYESYIHPITVLSALPVATVGGLLTLILFGQTASLYAFVGMFMLMGIVKKNGIMMIDFAIARQAEGLSPEKAVHEACMERFRPIIMTTMAALMGALPIAFGWGADSVSRMPLGLVIVGGLIVSQLITLYITPVIYLYLEAFQEKVMDHIPFFARGKRNG